MAGSAFNLLKDDQEIDQILNTVNTIAVVGASPNPERVSHQIMMLLSEKGYDVIAINPRPGLEEIEGIKVYPDLRSVDRPVDMVDVFRRPEHLMEVAKDAIAINAKVLWGAIGRCEPRGGRIGIRGGVESGDGQMPEN